jgi:hypothetical protein
MDLSEAVLDVSFYRPLVAAWVVDEEPHLFDGVLGSASGPGRNPYEVGQKSASKTGSSTSLAAICTILSRSGGMPRLLSFPERFGINRSRAGSGR